MAVYIDDMFAVVGQMQMCHMIADSPAELRSMAARIGVSLQWIQAEGTYREHFDVCRSKRALAIKFGAIETSQKEIGRLLIVKKAIIGTNGPTT